MPSTWHGRGRAARSPSATRRSANASTNGASRRVERPAETGSGQESGSWGATNDDLRHVFDAFRRLPGKRVVSGTTRSTRSTRFSAVLFIFGGFLCAYRKNASERVEDRLYQIRHV